VVGEKRSGGGVRNCALRPVVPNAIVIIRNPSYNFILNYSYPKYTSL
jgi:hypothetical protein